MKNSYQLCIDRGNTRTKLAIFDIKKELVLLETVSNDRFDVALIANLIRKYSIKVSILSSVKHKDKILISLLQTLSYCIQLSHNTPIPIQNDYATPHTLGLDRLAAAIGACNKFPQQNNLVIDAGTCITFDFIDEKHSYQGGAISPGLDMRFRALQAFTDKLPLLSTRNMGDLVGNDTYNSIVSGVLRGTIAELDGLIDQYRQQYGQLNVLVTGGDAHFFDTNLKNCIFAVPNLVLYGLLEILRYNLAHLNKHERA